MDGPRAEWRPGPAGLRAASIIAAIGLFLFLWRIGDPAKLNFDETAYVPAARLLNALSRPANIEHPLLGKYLVGWSIRLFGDTPVGWRVMSALFGAVALFATVMTATWTLRSIRAGVLAGGFALLGQLLFVMSRVAMLDIFLVAFLMLASWMIAVSVRADRGNRRRMALAGLFFGLAIGCKWSAVPFVPVIGLALATSRGAEAMRTGRGISGWLLAQDLGPVRGISTLEAGFWLGPFAVLAYFATFIPAFGYASDPLTFSGLIPFQFEMLRLQSGPMAPHTYQSTPWQWLFDLRPIWFFYEPVDGIQRGVLLVGNPVMMWAGAIAVPVALFLGLRRGAQGLAALALLYLLAWGMWLIIPKQVMFYHHYLLPSLYLCMVLAGVIEHLWLRHDRRHTPIALIAIGVLSFWYFYPILSAAPLEGPRAFQRWMLFDSWR